MSFFRKIDRTGDHHVKWDKTSSERQILCVFTHMQNLDLRKLMWHVRWEIVGGRSGKRRVCGG
jgi:hypothetical protein